MKLTLDVTGVEKKTGSLKLIIRLGRWQDKSVIKNMREVDFPIILEMKDLFPSGCYVLHNVVEHIGERIASGHYRAFVNLSPNSEKANFCCYDDAIRDQENPDLATMPVFNRLDHEIPYKKIDSDKGNDLLQTRLSSIVCSF
jgi:hypothetical protein